MSLFHENILDYALLYIATELPVGRREKENDHFTAIVHATRVRWPGARRHACALASDTLTHVIDTSTTSGGRRGIESSGQDIQYSCRRYSIVALCGDPLPPPPPRA